MKRHHHLIAPLALLALLVPLDAQELVVNPETGEFRLVRVDLTEPVEEFYAEEDHVGGSGRAVPFEASNPEWELPVLSLNKSRAMQKAADNVRSGKDGKAGGLEQFGLKAVPLIFNLLDGDTRIRKAVSTRAMEIPGDNGSAFTARLLTDDDAGIRAIARAKIERLSQAARIGLYHRSRGKTAEALVDGLLKDRKVRQYFDKLDGKWDRESTFKHLQNRRVPREIHQFIVEWLIDAPSIPGVKPSKADPRTREDQNKEFGKIINATKLAPNFKTLAKIRLGCKVKAAAIERAGRDPDWYVRARLCDALATRPDIKWRTPPALLERQRDLCLEVRVAANRALLSLHNLPHAFDSKRSHRFDSIQVAAWELWWLDRSKMAGALEDLWEERAAVLKPKKNIRVVWGDSPKVFDGLTGKHGMLGTVTFVDVNRDGDVHDYGVDRVVLGDPQKILSIPLSRVLVRKGKHYLIDVDSRTGRLRADKYRLRSWPVRIESTFPSPYKALGTIISSHADMNFAVRPEVTPLPAGFFNISGGWVLNKRSEVARITPPPGRGRIEISPDKEEQNVVYGPRLEVTVEARIDEADRKLQLRNVNITGAAGEIYKKFDPLVNTIQLEIKAGDKKKELRDWTARIVQYDTSTLGGLVPPLTNETAQSFLGLVVLIEASQNRISLELNPQRTLRDQERARLITQLNGVPALLTAKRAEKAAKDAEVVAKKAEQTQKEIELDVAQDSLNTKQAQLLQEQGSRNTMQANLTAKQAELAAAQAAVPPDNNLIAQLQAEVNQMTAELAAKDAQIATIQAEIATLQAQVNVLQTSLATLATQIAALEAEIAQLAAEILALENNTLQNQIALLDAQISALDAQISTEQASIAANEASLSTGSAQAGMTLELFKTALKLEPALKVMAQSLGDKSWDPYDIDLKDFGDFGDLDSLELRLKAQDLPFGKIKVTEVLVPLK